MSGVISAGVRFILICIWVGSAQQLQAQTLFREISEGAGLAFSHTMGELPVDISGPALIENRMFAGAACGDFDNDGWSDVFLVGGGAQPDQLYYNSEGQFERSESFAASNQPHVGGGVAVGDYDSDGDLDIFVGSLGPVEAQTIGQCRLYRNDGPGNFVNVAVEAGVNLTSLEHPDGSGACFGDYDLDGDLDLFVTGWRVRPSFGLGNVLFRNDGPENLGSFTDVTLEAGVKLARLAGITPTFVDLNGDRYPELCLTADFSTSRYFKNQGDGTFSNLTETSGTGLDTNGMGCCFADFDGNQLLDWYVTSIDDLVNLSTGNMLYLNQSEDFFTEQGVLSGVKEGYWGWGTVAGDWDNDGQVDLLENNGWYKPKFVDDNALLWMNQAGAFVDDAVNAGIDFGGQGRGALSFDFDRDGDLDILMTRNNGPLGLFENQLDAQPRNFLRVRLDTEERPDLAPAGYGAHLELRLGSERFIQVLGCQNTFVSQSEVVAHFGLGSAELIDELTVTWPDGAQSAFVDLPVNRAIVVRAPAQGGDSK